MAIRTIGNPRAWIRASLRWFAVGALTVMASACATGSPGSASLDTVNDPLEGFNRAVFAANNAIDRAVIRPVSYGYREVVPEVFRDRIRDFLRNLRSPIIIANELLQGDFEGAGNAAGRFFLNSTLGLGGFIDFAGTYADMPYEPEDFGQTLAVWGVPEGPYLVLPLLGPSSARDAAGFVADTLADPVRIIAANNDQDWFNYVRYGATILDERSRSIEATDELERSSVDYYATVRSLYRQMRQAEIDDSDANPAGVDIPDFDSPDGSNQGGGVDIPDYSGPTQAPVPIDASPISALPAPLSQPQMGQLSQAAIPLDLTLPPVTP